MALSPASHRTALSSLPTYICQQCRHATLIRRPKRPYTFTQLVTLSDGSSYLHRTTSPAPVHASLKDTRNSPLWNPSSQKLLSVEADEAGRLRAFRQRFGRGWDAKEGAQVSAAEDLEDDGKPAAGEEEDEGDFGDNLMDLISDYGQQEGGGGQDSQALRDPKKKKN